MSTPTLTSHVADFIVSDDRGTTDGTIREKAKQHILDCAVAMLSGSTLPAGVVGRNYAREQCPEGAATVFGTLRQTSSTECAALANGMSAHADETDDCNELARLHPGASIIPATLALAERMEPDGPRLLRAVSVGYDVGCSMARSAWGSIALRQRSVQRPSGIGQTFGAMAAAAVVAGLNHVQVRHAMSYTAQMASGLTSYLRDDSHIEKAFALAGMQARVGVAAVELVLAGATGVDDILDTHPTIFDVFGEEGQPDLLKAELGVVSHLMTSDIKKYPTGGPIQAAAQALEELMVAHRIEAEHVDHIECRLPAGKGSVVKDRSIPDIDAAHLLALGIVDGRIHFRNAHDYDRLSDERVAELRARIDVVLDRSLDPAESLDGSSRRAILMVAMTDGSRHERRVDHFRGSRLNRMEWHEIEAKAMDVLAGWSDTPRVSALISQIHGLDTTTTTASLISSLQS